MEENNNNYAQFAVTREEQEKKTDAIKRKREKEKKKSSRATNFFIGLLGLCLGLPICILGFNKYIETSDVYKAATAIVDNSSIVETDSIEYGDPYVVSEFHNATDDEESYTSNRIMQKMVVTYTVDGQTYQKDLGGIKVYYTENKSDEAALAEAAEEEAINSTDSRKLYVDNDDPSIAYDMQTIRSQTYDDGLFYLLVIALGAFFLLWPLAVVIDIIKGNF